MIYNRKPIEYDSAESHTLMYLFNKKNNTNIEVSISKHYSKHFFFDSFFFLQNKNDRYESINLNRFNHARLVADETRFRSKTIYRARYPSSLFPFFGFSPIIHICFWAND